MYLDTPFGKYVINPWQLGIPCLGEEYLVENVCAYYQLFLSVLKAMYFIVRNVFKSQTFYTVN